MDDKLIDRVFSELDTHSKRLVDLSEAVHTNAGILGIVTKLVVAIIIFVVITSLGVFYSHFKTVSNLALYHRQIAPITDNIKTYGIDPNPPNKKDKKGGL